MGRKALQAVDDAAVLAGQKQLQGPRAWYAADCAAAVTALPGVTIPDTAADKRDVRAAGDQASKRTGRRMARMYGQGCDQCGTLGLDLQQGKKLQLCRGCELSWYCSREG
jgi:hypothetical protein